MTCNISFSLLIHCLIDGECPYVPLSPVIVKYPLSVLINYANLDMTLKMCYLTIQESSFNSHNIICITLCTTHTFLMIMLVEYFN